MWAFSNGLYCHTTLGLLYFIFDLCIKIYLTQPISKDCFLNGYSIRVTWYIKTTYNIGFSNRLWYIWILRFDIMLMISAYCNFLSYRKEGYHSPKRNRCAPMFKKYDPFNACLKLKKKINLLIELEMSYTFMFIILQVGAIFNN